MEKRIVEIGNGSIAVKYDHRTKKVVLGGHQSMRGPLEAVIGRYFNKDIPRIKWTQVNKVRFVITCKSDRFDKAMELLAEQGCVVSIVTSLGRMMR